jgi:hypothetical protein
MAFSGMGVVPKSHICCQFFIEEGRKQAMVHKLNRGFQQFLFKLTTKST